MAGLDPTIYQRFAQPKSVADYDLEAANVQQAQQANALNKLRLLQGQRAEQDAQRQLQEQEGMRNALSGLGSGATDEQRINALLGLGTQGGFSAADALRKAATERARVEAQANEQNANALKTRVGIIKAGLGYVFQNPTPAAANSAIDFAEKLTGQNLDNYRAEIAQLQTPEDFKKWAAGHSLDVEKQLPSFTTRNTGQVTQTLAQNPVLGTVTPVSSVQNTPSPGEVLAANTAAAGRAQAERHFQAGQNAPKLAYDSERGMLIDQRTGKAVPVTAEGVPIGPKATSDKLTEDQGKATAWLVQAENAFKNMQGATNPQTGTPSAARPGFLDALAAIPSLGATEALANQFRSPDRQKFMQASSSLSEALLRAATGAGVNKEEAAQKIRELTPVFGEKEETTAQKMASIPLYIETLKVRAGPGAKKASGLVAPPELPGQALPSADAIAAELKRRGL